MAAPAPPKQTIGEEVAALAYQVRQQTTRTKKHSKIKDRRDPTETNLLSERTIKRLISLTEMSDHPHQSLPRC
jgi:hypothetical protein